MNESEHWRRCSACKKGIGFSTAYYVCSVSTCTRVGPGGFVFCSVPCFDTHIPTMRHREAWAEEQRAPSRAEDQAAEERHAPGEEAADGRPRRRIIVGEAPAPAAPRGTDLPVDVLVVASKLKAYVKARSGMNTSDTVLDPLSDQLRALADEAIEAARADGRKTVLARDVPKPVPAR